MQQRHVLKKADATAAAAVIVAGANAAAGPIYQRFVRSGHPRETV